MKKISRSDFLKISGLSFGGLLMLPHHSCSGISNKKLTINGNNNYQIVIPANASKIEEEVSLGAGRFGYSVNETSSATI